MSKTAATLEDRIGYRFSRPQLLTEALTHRSWVREAPAPTPDNQRLEFLGDAVLGLLASQTLMQRFPDYSEGLLSKIKARLVSAAALHETALQLDLGNCLLMGRAEEANGGRAKPNLLVDALEALIAAVYLDGGLEAAADITRRTVLAPDRIERAEQNLASDNAKSELQEILQSRQLALPDYRVLEEHGPPHDPVFRIELSIGDRFRAEASGRTKRIAEQSAARQALESLDDWLPAD
jgi:ribonuclease-3